MAIREVRYEGDSVLRKVCKPVKAIDQKLIDLIGNAVFGVGVHVARRLVAVKPDRDVLLGGGRKRAFAF